MPLPVELKPAIWGAIGGAVALAITGFSWGGWVTAGTAETLGKQKAASAVTAALAPICADSFRRGKDAPEKLAELKKVSSWEQATFIEKGGWAKMPGTEAIDSGTARACAEMILAAKT